MPGQGMLNAGVIGLGVGEQHAATYHKHPACRVRTLCDFDQEKLLLVGQKYPDAHLCQSAEEVFADPEIDIVSIASFDNHHATQILSAINAGKHLFVEKPLCLFPGEVQQVKQALQRRPEVRLSSNLILRLCPRFCELRTLLQQGRLGQLYYVEAAYNYGRLQKLTEGWRGQLDYYSVVLGGAIHLVDLLLWLTGDRVLEVQGYGNRIATDGTRFQFNDCVVALLRFESGLIAKVAANFGCVYPHFHQLNLYGTQATFCNQLEAGQLFKKRGSPEHERLMAPYPGVRKGELLHNFVDSILHGEPVPVTTAEIFETMAICFAIEEAVNLSVPVAVQKFRE